ncbi:hypothetical protein BDR26DRAFT_849982 [Obelidium mucronatum]|nr:hypothetical protein BDR26DRAFT_849982 [Obelidium mucronatum]
MLLNNLFTIATLFLGVSALPQKATNLNQIRGAGQGIAAAQQRAGPNVKIIEQIVTPTPGDATALQFRVAMPTTVTPNMGLNVLLHGDGGQSFFAFPNAKLDNNLIGVAVLAPNAPMKWGGVGNNRPDGPKHATLVRDLVTRVLPAMMPGFNQSNVFFTGVSGGALTLTSAIDSISNAIGPNTRIHFQSTTKELTFLKQSIPQAIADVNKAVQALGLPAAQAAKQFTVDATPNGGHCAFDGQAFGSGIQAMVNQFGAVMFGSQAAAGITAAALKPLSQATGATLFAAGGGAAGGAGGAGKAGKKAAN